MMIAFMESYEWLCTWAETHLPKEIVIECFMDIMTAMTVGTETVVYQED